MSMVKVFALILGYFVLRAAVSGGDQAAEKTNEIKDLRVHISSADSLPPI